MRSLVRKEVLRLGQLDPGLCEVRHRALRVNLRMIQHRLCGDQLSIRPHIAIAFWIERVLRAEAFFYRPAEKLRPVRAFLGAASIDKQVAIIDAGLRPLKRLALCLKHFHGRPVKCLRSRPHADGTWLSGFRVPKREIRLRQPLCTSGSRPVNREPTIVKSPCRLAERVLGIQKQIERLRSALQPTGSKLCVSRVHLTCALVPYVSVAVARVLGAQLHGIFDPATVAAERVGVLDQPPDRAAAKQHRLLVVVRIFLCRRQVTRRAYEVHGCGNRISPEESRLGARLPGGNANLRTHQLRSPLRVLQLCQRGVGFVVHLFLL